MDDIPDRLYFLLEINDGYSFRNLIDYLKCSNAEGNFLFSPKEVTYTQIDGTSVILNTFKIKTCMLRYIFNSKEDVLVGVQLTELQQNTRNVGKKDGIRLYMKQDDPNLYIQILSANKGSRGNVSFVRTRNIDFCSLDLPTFNRSNDEPNAVAVISDFAKACKIVSSIKCDYVYFQGFPRGVKISAYLEGHLVGKAEKFGDCDNFPTGGTKYPDIRSVVESIPLDADSNGETQKQPSKKLKLIVRPSDDVPTIRVPSKIIAYLSKTNNTSQNGIVRMYFEEEASPFSLSHRLLWKANRLDKGPKYTSGIY